MDKDSHKDTEFNSNLATLIRINNLIVQIHLLRRGIIPLNNFGVPLKSGNPTELYIDTLYGLWIEINAKMTPDEKNQNNTKQKSINDIKDYYGSNLNKNTYVKGMPAQEYVNDKYYEGWDKLNNAADDYFLFLMGSADFHGMLLTNKIDEDEEPDEWSDTD